MDKQTKIEVLKLLRTITQRTCKRCIRTYEIPVSVMVDEINKELARLSPHQTAERD